MKILIFSDLHLCDTRNSREYEENRLRMLAGYIRSCGAGAVVNLGDTVSRKEFLREEFACEADGFDRYLEWRKQFDVPFSSVPSAGNPVFLPKNSSRIWIPGANLTDI